MEEVYKRLKKYIDKKRNCIICGSNKFYLWGRLYYLGALRCRGCGMVSVNPHINEDGLKIFYGTYLRNRFENKVLCHDRKIMYKLEYEFINKFISRGSVLDLGCSGGFFLNEFDRRKWKRKGIEIDSNAAHYAKKKFGIEVIEGDFSDLDLGKEKFDLVVLRGVIEHCIEPGSYLKKCASILRNKGMLFITATPNIESFCAEVYREKWRLFTPIEHLHFFSVDLLDKILHPFGFELVEKKYFYEETPYANLPRDYEKMKRDILLIAKGRRDIIKDSVPFWGNMITAVWTIKK
jgi:2-polyprenyl-3-methyl-5-hydroxy-6-metoxy-1,4-benzoquinol methylase